MTLSDTQDQQPLLTPFPRPNHLALLRQEKQQRRRRRGALLAAVAACLTVVGGSVSAASAASAPREVAAITTAAQDAHAAQAASDVLDDAKTAVEDAAEGVDTDTLKKYVTTLSAYEKLPAVVVVGVADEAKGEVEQVQAETAAVEQKQAEEKAAAEKKAAEERAAAEAEAAAAAAALAAANTPEGAQETARTMAADQYGWGDDQFGCLVSLWNKESGWSHTATNASSGAYGIPQSLPGSKMASAGADWESNAATQIAWGLGYIADVYGTPCGAWGHSQSTGWY